MKILFCGGRKYNNTNKVVDVMNSLIEEFGRFGIIHGGAYGADTLCGAVGTAMFGLYEEVYEAQWGYYGKKAGIMRNIRMLEEGKPDLVVAFPGGKGTAHMCKIARDVGIEIRNIIDE